MSEQPNITITSTASKHIRNQLQQTQAQYLRLGVKESGCNGYMYMLDFLDDPATDDQCFDFGDGVRVCVRSADMELVNGTEVDMITEGLNSALVFKNPRAVSYCGCGESFAVDASRTGEAGNTVGDLATDVGRH
jgi:iron-sulfur cluster assembly accessory protein